MDIKIMKLIKAVRRSLYRVHNPTLLNCTAPSAAACAQYYDVSLETQLTLDLR